MTKIKFEDRSAFEVMVRFSNYVNNLNREFEQFEIELFEDVYDLLVQKTDRIEALEGEIADMPPAERRTGPIPEEKHASAQQQALYEAALGKLTPEERRILGL
jgi:hypothetical protein